jgi:hypothetical protein
VDPLGRGFSFTVAPEHDRIFELTGPFRSANGARPGQCDYYRRHLEAAEAARRAVTEAKAKQ